MALDRLYSYKYLLADRDKEVVITMSKN